MSEITNKRIVELDAEDKLESSDYLLIDSQTKGTRKISYEDLIKYNLTYSHELTAEAQVLLNVPSSDYSFDNELKIFIEATLTAASGVLFFYINDNDSYNWAVESDSIQACITLKRLNDIYTSIEISDTNGRTILTTATAGRMRITGLGYRFAAGSSVNMFNR